MDDMAFDDDFECPEPVRSNNQQDHHASVDDLHSLESALIRGTVLHICVDNQRMWPVLHRRHNPILWQMEMTFGQELAAYTGRLGHYMPTLNLAWTYMYEWHRVGKIVERIPEAFSALRPVTLNEDELMAAPTGGKPDLWLDLFNENACNEFVLIKDEDDAFASSNAHCLECFLDRNKIEAAVFTGGRNDACLPVTARSAARFGLKTFLVPDMTISTNSVRSLDNPESRGWFYHLCESGIVEISSEELLKLASRAKRLAL